MTLLLILFALLAAGAFGFAWLADVAIRRVGRVVQRWVAWLAEFCCRVLGHVEEWYETGCAPATDETWYLAAFPGALARWNCWCPCCRQWIEWSSE